MEKLHKEPDIRRQDYNAFVNELKLFHQNRGTPFRYLPRINGREIDLLKLYNQVTALGGLQKVNDQQKWGIVADSLKLPKACVNFFLALWQLYIRFLGTYEKIHFLGEEPDNDRSQSVESHHRKQQTAILHPVPMSYNYTQHEISDSVRAASGLNQSFHNTTNYDKLCSSLLSCLPNELELALNLCTILSNEGNYMLHLEKCPKLVNLLLAQAGIWSTEDTILKQHLHENCDGLKGQNMRRFWRSALNRNNRQICELCNWILDKDDADDDSFLNLELDAGILNMEGQRVLRIALILHNLSFEKNNIPVLVSSENFLKFAVLCMHTKWAELMQIAYDTVSNIASEIQLHIGKDTCLRLFFQTVVDGILSPDRFLVIKSLDIFSKLCSCGANEDMIPSWIDIEVYEKMITFLTVHDIMLLFYTLEALYMLSDLGRYACEKIVGVHRSIGILVNLLTMDPNQYGSSAYRSMKLVETLVPTESDPEPKESTFSAATSQSSTTTSTTTPARASTSGVNSEAFACNWLRSSYEYNPGSAVARNEIYEDYVSCCDKAGRCGVNADAFASYVKTVFSQCGLTKVESSNGIISFHHKGLQRKRGIMSQAGCTPVKLASPCATPVKNVTLSSSVCPIAPQKSIHSPILKAQLSAPSQPGGNTFDMKGSVQPITPVRQTVALVQSPSSNTSPTVQVNTPHKGSLIKSLLGNKVQRQPHIQPNVRKMVIYSPAKPGNITRNITNTVLGELDCKTEEVGKPLFEKDKICKGASLLKGLLDKGKGPLAKEISSFSVIQNNKTVPSVLEINSKKKSSVISPALVTTPFTSVEDNLLQMCARQLTFSGTIEAQPDQKGVVRLHIESPENSNQDSDLSSISDIAQTLECASKAISRTNAECNSQVPFTGSCETTSTLTAITTNTPTLARSGSGQQIIVTPALNQPQLHIQLPNIKFRILHSMSEVEDLIAFPRVPLNQIRQPVIESRTVSSIVCAKRPSSDSQKLSLLDSKKPRIDTRTPLLKAATKPPTSVPALTPTNDTLKPSEDNQPVLPKSITSINKLSQTSKFTTAKAVAVPVQNVNFPSEKEAKTFHGLSSADRSSVITTANTPSKPNTSSILEYICEWKGCRKKFPSSRAVFVHVSKLHVPHCNNERICLWEGCDSVKRRRLSLLTHLQDWHCNEKVLHDQALRQKQMTQQGKTSISPPQMPSPHPGYPPDAALLAIKRHAIQYLNPKELSEEKESSLAKSIRLTSALILRNLVTHSSVARSYLRCNETDLAYLAMSPIESSRTIAQCLSELARTHD